MSDTGLEGLEGTVVSNLSSRSVYEKNRFLVRALPNIHRSALDHLEPFLRIHGGCGRACRAQGPTLRQR